MKRFLVFGTNQYEINGGWGDFNVAADTLEEARFLGDAGEFDFCEVVDLEKMAVVVKFAGTSSTASNVSCGSLTTSALSPIRGAGDVE